MPDKWDSPAPVLQPKPLTEARATRTLPFFPPLAPFKITRAGDLTALDTIGIPVWFAARPNARALSISQGKGLTHEQARLSAIMEAIEGAVAEQTRSLIVEFGTPSELTARGLQIVPLDRLTRCRTASFDAGRQRAWVRGVDFATTQPIYAPYELIGLDMRADFPWDYAAFHVSSVGLAAGFDFPFAALAALLEVIEHDATALNDMFGHFSALAEPMSWQPGHHAGLDKAVDRICAAGLEPRFFDVTSRIGIPVVGAVITRPVLDGRGGGEQLSGGDACRLDAGEAALAALLEAVQSRLTNIAGSRDDLEMSQYEGGGSTMPSLPAQMKTIADLAKSHSSPAGMTTAEKLDLVASRLRRAGYPDIFLFDLAGPVDGVHVVRALVPGLKTFVDGDVATVSVDDLMQPRRGEG